MHGGETVREAAEEEDDDDAGRRGRHPGAGGGAPRGCGARTEGRPVWGKIRGFPWWPASGLRDACHAADADAPRLGVRYCHTNEEDEVALSRMGALRRDADAGGGFLPKIKSKAIAKKWHAALAEAKAQWGGDDEAEAAAAAAASPLQGGANVHNLQPGDAVWFVGAPGARGRVRAEVLRVDGAQPVIRLDDLVEGDAARRRAGSVSSRSSTRRRPTTRRRRRPSPPPRRRRRPSRRRITSPGRRRRRRRRWRRRRAARGRRRRRWRRRCVATCCGVLRVSSRGGRWCARAKATDADDPSCACSSCTMNDDYWMPKDKLAAWGSMPEVLRYGGKSKAIRRQWHAALAVAKAPRDASIEAKGMPRMLRRARRRRRRRRRRPRSRRRRWRRRRSRRWPRRRRRRAS